MFALIFFSIICPYKEFRHEDFDDAAAVVVVLEAVVVLLLFKVPAGTDILLRFFSVIPLEALVFWPPTVVVLKTLQVQSREATFRFLSTCISDWSQLSLLHLKEASRQERKLGSNFMSACTGSKLFCENFSLTGEKVCWFLEMQSLVPKWLAFDDISGPL